MPPIQVYLQMFSINQTTIKKLIKIVNIKIRKYNQGFTSKLLLKISN